MYQPKELSINLGSYFALAGGTSITLQKMKLGGGAKGTLPDLVVPITATNFNANTKVLKITGSDMQNLIARIFNEVQYQFGPEATKPPTAVTVSGTTVVRTAADGDEITHLVESELGQGGIARAAARRPGCEPVVPAALGSAADGPFTRRSVRDVLMHNGLYTSGGELVGRTKVEPGQPRADHRSSR